MMKKCLILMNEFNDEVLGREPVESDKLRVLFKRGAPLVIKTSTWVDLGLKLGLPVNDSLRGQLEESAEIDAATDLALRYFRFRRRSQQEIFTYLDRHEVPRGIADKVIRWLADRQLIDDSQYARDLVELKKHSLSRREMALRLSRLGLQMPPGDEAEAASAEEAELSAALAAARKHWRNHSHDDVRQRRNKLMGYLQRRGFCSSVIRRVVEQLATESASDESFGMDDGDV